MVVIMLAVAIENQVNRPFQIKNMEQEPFVWRLNKALRAALILWNSGL